MSKLRSAKEHETNESETSKLMDGSNAMERFASDSSCDQLLVAPKLMYFWFAASQSAFINYVAVFFEHTAGFSKVQIGVLQTLPCVCALIAPPVWGLVADRLRNQRAVHIFCIVSGALLMCAVQFVRSYNLMIIMIIAANFQLAPTGSLLDHAVLAILERVGGEYGKQRLFAAIGYGIGAYVTGLFVSNFGVTSAFNVQLFMALTSLMILRYIPAPLSASTETQEPAPSRMVEATVQHEDEASSWSGLLALWAKFDVVVLLLVVFFLGLMFGVLSSFLTLNLFNLSGSNPQIIGVAILCETMSELPAFFYAQKIIDRLGVVNVLLMSIAGYGVRISYYFLMTNAWSAIPFEFLHGATFGLAWAACTQYIYASSPKGLEGTTMGILNAVQNGLGRGLGTILGGVAYHSYGAKTMWLLTDLGVPLSLLGVAVFAVLKSRHEALEEDQELLLERADLFSPHHTAISPLKSPHFKPTYEPVE